MKSHVAFSALFFAALLFLADPASADRPARFKTVFSLTIVNKVASHTMLLLAENSFSPINLIGVPTAWECIALPIKQEHSIMYVDIYCKLLNTPHVVYATVSCDHDEEDFAKTSFGLINNSAEGVNSLVFMTLSCSTDRS